MKLIVGLGNPGNEYINTRHNVGFNFLDNVLKKCNDYQEKRKFDGLYSIVELNGEKIMLLKPEKYMNLSGEVLKKYTDFFKIDINDILVIHDDLDLPCGKIRIRYKGSSGGHNGLKNIETNLKTNCYKRIRIGISHPEKNNIVDFVLGKFTKEETEVINSTLSNAFDIINDYINLTFENFMNKYN